MHFTVVVFAISCFGRLSLGSPNPASISSAGAVTSSWPTTSGPYSAPSSGPDCKCDDGTTCTGGSQCMKGDHGEKGCCRPGDLCVWPSATFTGSYSGYTNGPGLGWHTTFYGSWPSGWPGEHSSGASWSTWPGWGDCSGWGSSDYYSSGRDGRHYNTDSSSGAGWTSGWSGRPYPASACPTTTTTSSASTGPFDSVSAAGTGAGGAAANGTGVAATSTPTTDASGGASVYAADAVVAKVHLGLFVCFAGMLVLL